MAITTRAPSARQAETGTGLTSAPSTSQRPPICTGWKTPGSANEARSAGTSAPERSQISCPVPSSVATHRNARSISSMRMSPRSRFKSRTSRRPPISPPLPNTGSISPTTLRRVRERAKASSASSLPAMAAAPITAPIDVPVTMSARMPASSSTRMAPMWAQPRAAPPPSARPMRGVNPFDHTGSAEGTGAGRAAGSVRVMIRRSQGGAGWLSSTRP